MRTVKITLIALAVFSSQIALAQIPAAFVNDLVKAEARLKDKLDAKIQATTTQKTEPTEDNFKEFGKLVDKAYLELDADKAEILKLKKSDPKLKERVGTWVKVAALATALDPSDSVVELSTDIEKKFPLEFNESIQGLDQKLQIRFQEALSVLKKVRKRGNG